MRRRKQGKLKLRKLAFKAKKGYYPIHKKSTNIICGRDYSIKRYWMGDSIRQIKDEEVLFDIAKNHDNPSFRVLAVVNSNLKDDDKLLNIVCECNGYVLRTTATAKLRDERNLMDLLENHYDWHVRREALRNPNLLDKKSFENAALNDEDYMVRREAVKHIENQDLLVRLAKNDEDALVRINALEKITNMDIIVFAAKNDSSWRVRVAAVGMIDRVEVLDELLGLEKDAFIQNAIEERIESVIRQIILNKNRLNTMS